MSYQVAIDGPAGAGKSTIARQVAKNKGFIYVDTGAMYRAMALHMIRSNVDIKDAEAIAKAKKEYAKDIEFYKMLQYLFFKQWNELKAYANENNIEIIGDVPIYVAGDFEAEWI